ncbi:phosphate transporter PHO1 homolog 1-like [Selaginella moellendorffii]|uniref:phosphate transporter PHO1 homolog 1-like n=1 Tax=Selaginella moellendorffii TaxID=88036 RepID=UPI000D1C3B71|nr:phosphate transporter PHO1 homolog 1-like [Selaginella moellendorffii]|eukprot:XP_024522603.1 phosphate transporter PHO1 homolog 1-like [Selaginella moellendorffii]
MKFQKQLQWQLVPEWRDSYCDYKDLKKELRKIKRSGPARRSWMPGYLLGRRRRKIEIVVHSRGGHAAFETELDSAASENERAFFRALDLQLGIVNGFYIAREGELESRARMLLLQLENDHHSVTGDARKSSSLCNAVADLCRQLSLLRNYRSGLIRNSRMLIFGVLAAAR